MNELYDFDDILIEPAVLSDISSRKQIDPTYKGRLPLMTAPMDTVIDEKNIKYFKNLGITPILPRIKYPGDNYYSFEHFLSYGIDDFDKIFLKKVVDIPEDKRVYVLIDIANGHMRKLFDMSKQAKKTYGDKMVLMVGNVANPLTFEKYCLIGVDYVRIGIGNGDGCLTTVQTGVGYSLPNLIKECRHVINNRMKTFDSRIDGEFENYRFKTKIVADGGFKKHSDIIKGLGMGADYIMLGSIFNRTLESAGLTTDRNGTVIDQYSKEAKEMISVEIPLFKSFRGMSTKDVQKEWGKSELTTSEGIVKTQQVGETLSGWTDNFVNYLKSAMSYTGKKELHQFIGGVLFNRITQNVFKRFDK
jgi:IMP dehydrogenase/GMP reductase